MSTVTIDKAAPTRKVKYGSMSRDRTWALRWSYFFLVIFAVFSLTADSMSNAQAASGTFLFLALGAVEAAAALESNRPAGPRVRRSQATRGSQATPMR